MTSLIAVKKLCFVISLFVSCDGFIFDGQVNGLFCLVRLLALNLNAKKRNDYILI